MGVGLKSLEIRGSETDSEAPLVKISLVYFLSVATVIIDSQADKNIQVRSILFGSSNFNF